MSNQKHEQLEQLVAAMRASRNYKSVSEAFIRSIGTRELARTGSLKVAIKATKNTLHQVGGAYLEYEAPNYSLWLDELKRVAQCEKKELLLAMCARIMSHHASTRERLPVLASFYTTLFAHLPPIHSVLDIACGFHPLAVPWMPLAAPVTYYAYDVYSDMVCFLNEFMQLMAIDGSVRVRDVISSCPTERVDLAFLLKALPCLEQVDKTASARLLETINADYLVVSFPAHSLGGRKKGMPANYETRFRELVAQKDWSIQRFEFPSELVFLINKINK